MNKIIYKQKNTIVLALLVLGGVVCNVGVTSSASSSSSARLQECVTRGDNAQLGITLNPSQIRASDTGNNRYVSLAGSSGDIPIGRPTPATGITDASDTPEILVTNMNGTHITSVPKTNLSAAIKSIRAELGIPNVWIDLIKNTDKIEDETQFAKVQGKIQCVILPLSQKAKRDAEEIYEKLKTVFRFNVSQELEQFLETKRQEYLYNKKEELSYLLPNEYVNNFLRVYVDLICDDISKNIDCAWSNRHCAWSNVIIEILIQAIEQWEISHKCHKAMLAGDVVTHFKSIVKDLLDTPEHIQEKLDTLMTFLDNNRDTVQDRWSELCIMTKEWMPSSQVEEVRLIQDTLQNWKEKNSIIPEERTNNDVFLTSFADMITQSTNNDGKTVEEKVKEFNTFLANNIVSIKDTLDQCKEKFRSKEWFLCNECVRAWSVCCRRLTRLNRLRERGMFNHTNATLISRLIGFRGYDYT